MGNEEAPLLDGQEVVATSTGTLHKSRTVHALLESSSAADRDEANMFLRRLWALLVFQYGTILFLSSPFALIDPFRRAVGPYHGFLEVVAVSGIVISLCLAIAKGAIYPFAHVALASLTLFVALEMGLTFAHESWGPSGIVALGQATTSFAIILGLLQFDSRSMMWLSYPTAALLCLFLSGLWTVVQVEIGFSWPIAAAISMGGWLYTLLVLFCCSVVSEHVAPEEYILGTLFILCPEALLCLATKERHPADEDVDHSEAETNLTEQKCEYEAV